MVRTSIVPALVGKAMVPGVFISYRRGDEPAYARLLHLTISSLREQPSVFIDIDAIEPGAFFQKSIADGIAACGIFIVLIGENWHGKQSQNAPSRLASPDDYVRREIETALKFGKTIVPVLIESTPVPTAFDLPASIAALASLNAIRITHMNFSLEIQPVLDLITKGTGRVDGRRHNRTHTLTISGMNHQLALITSPSGCEAADQTIVDGLGKKLTINVCPSHRTNIISFGMNNMIVAPRSLMEMLSIDERGRNNMVVWR